MSTVDMLYNFGQTANKGNPLTKIGQQYAGLIQQKNAREAARIAEENYGQARDAYYSNQGDPEVYARYMAAAEAAGKTELAKNTVSGMDEITQKNGLRRALQPYNALYSGNNEIAIDLLEQESLADPSSKKRNDIYIQKIKDGLGSDVMGNLGATAGMYTGGTEALDNIWAMNKDKRDAVASEGKLFEIIQSNSWNSEADKTDYAKAMEGLSLPTAKILGELASVKSSTGEELTLAQKQVGEAALRKEYDAYTGDYLTMMNSAESIKALSTLKTGVADQGMIVFYNKVLDPPSVVRKSEAEMTAEQQALLDRVRAYAKNLTEGDMISDKARMDIVESSALLADLAKKRDEEEIARLMNTVNTYGYRRENIFFPEGYRDNEQDDFFLKRRELIQAASETGASTTFIEALSAVEDIEGLKSFGDGSLYKSLYQEEDPVTTTEDPATTTTEDPVASGTPFQEFVIKQNNLTGRAADNVRNMSDERLMEGNPGTASTWKAQQDAPAETELAPKIPDQPIQAEIRSKILNKARLQGNTGTQMYKDIQTMSIQELEKKYPELYKEFSTPADVWEF